MLFTQSNTYKVVALCGTLRYSPALASTHFAYRRLKLNDHCFMYREKMFDRESRLIRAQFQKQTFTSIEISPSLRRPQRSLSGQHRFITAHHCRHRNNISSISSSTKRLSCCTKLCRLSAYFWVVIRAVWQQDSECNIVHCCWHIHQRYCHLLVQVGYLLIDYLLYKC